MNELYKKIEALCKKKGITITAMCKEANVNRGNLSDLKTGRQSDLSKKNLEKIAAYLEVTPAYLMGWAEEPKVDPMSCIPLGERVKSVREAAGLTQEELGAKLGVTGDTIKRYETGQWELKVDTLYKIADALEIEIQRLLGKPITLDSVCDEAKRIDGAVRIGRKGGDEFIVMYIHPKDEGTVLEVPARQKPEPAKHTVPDKLPIEKIEGGEKRPMYQAIIHLLGIKGITLARMCFDLKLCRADIQALNGYQKGVISEPNLEKIAAYLDTTVADIKKEADRQKAARQCGFTSPYQEDVDPRNNTLQIPKWYEPNRRFVELTEETYQELQALVESTGRSIDYLVEALMEFALARVTVVEPRSAD